jgi:hypothetical protein
LKVSFERKRKRERNRELGGEETEKHSTKKKGEFFWIDWKTEIWKRRKEKKTI